jgi:hypothetical protein
MYVYVEGRRWVAFNGCHRSALGYRVQIGSFRAGSPDPMYKSAHTTVQGLARRHEVGKVTLALCLRAHNAN